MGHATVPRYVSLLTVFYFISFQTNIIKKPLVYIEMTDWQFSKKKLSTSGENKERFQKSFPGKWFNIVIKCNLKIFDYLDVTLNLLNNTYKPFCKPSNEINYTHKESNPPLSIIKPVPFSIKSRLSSLSSSEKVFNETMPIYQETLKKSEYDHKLKYQKHYSSTTSKQQREFPEKENDLV